MPVGKHHMQKWYVGGKSALRCKADGCDFQSNPQMTERAQRETARLHRKAMGEEVSTGPLKLEQHERIKLLRRVHVGFMTNVSVNDKGGVTRGEVCNECRKPFPCLTARLVDGDATAIELVPVGG